MLLNGLYLKVFPWFFLGPKMLRTYIISFFYRLSERNCIEIINKLIELNLLDVCHTSNGKEFLTPSQLNREIKDELFVHGGEYWLDYLN